MLREAEGGRPRSFIPAAFGKTGKDRAHSLRGSQPGFAGGADLLAMHVPVSTVTIFASAFLSAVTGYITSRISQRRQRLINTHTYRLAILVEVREFQRQLLEYETAFEQRVVTGQISSAQLMRIRLQFVDAGVFTKDPSSIGLFDRRTALRVLRFYADLRTLQARALVLSELSSAGGSPLLEQEMRRHLTVVRQVRRSARLLLRRLRRGRLRSPRVVRLVMRRLTWARTPRLSPARGRGSVSRPPQQITGT